MKELRVAWLLPIAWFYWHPVLSRFAQMFPDTTIFTALFPGFAKGFEDTFSVRVIGKIKFIETSQKSTGYGSGFTSLSPWIIKDLIQLKPQLIFADSFRIWSLFALLLKPLFNWRVILTYEGSSPGVDYRNSALRLFLRRVMVHLADAYITNTNSGKSYLVDILGAKQEKVFAMPYEVPDAKSLLDELNDNEARSLNYKTPTFLFVGHLVPRKGLQYLLQSCLLLKQQGYDDYTLLIAGSGSEKKTLEAFSEKHDLVDQIRWLGHVSYESLGTYFHDSDAFILPTLEDTWGMVVLEAMLFEKPVLCSKWAGSSEMILDGENGYVFDPYHPEELAKHMEWMIKNPKLVNEMGKKSKRKISGHTPEIVSESLAKIIDFVFSQ